jgi:hypothetical protein
VLSGAIGALLAQGLEPYDAARLGVWLHGAAGDLAAERFGEHGMTAGDLIETLPLAMRALVRRREERQPGRARTEALSMIGRGSASRPVEAARPKRSSAKTAPARNAPRAERPATAGRPTRGKKK